MYSFPEHTPNEKHDKCIKIINVSLLLYSVKSNPKFKGLLPSLSSFLATEHPLNITKNAFYFTLKALLVPKIYVFGHVEKGANKKVKINF